MPTKSLSHKTLQRIPLDGGTITHRCKGLFRVLGSAQSTSSRREPCIGTHLPGQSRLFPIQRSLLRVQVRHLIRALNEATDAIPGWDEYAKTGKATQLWDGSL